MMHGAVPKTSSRVAACNHKEVKFIDCAVHAWWWKGDNKEIKVLTEVRRLS